MKAIVAAMSLAFLALAGLGVMKTAEALNSVAAELSARR